MRPSRPDFSNDVLGVDELPQLDAVVFTPIEGRYRYPLYAATTVFFAFLFLLTIVGALVIFGLFHWLTYLALILVIVCYLLSLLFASERVKRMAYVIREQDVSFREGVFFQDWTTIPFNRIQHCEVSKGVFERMYKLATLKIYTAGGSGSDVSIPGLATEDAMRLRDFIIAKIQATDEEE